MNAVGIDVSKGKSMVFSLVSSCNGVPPFVFYGGMPAAGKWSGHEKRASVFTPPC